MSVTSKRPPSKKKVVGPDWHSINLSFNAKQRRAFNAYRDHIWLLAERIQEIARAYGHENTPMSQELEDVARKLMDEINSIPSMWY